MLLTVGKDRFEFFGRKVFREGDDYEQIQKRIFNLFDGWFDGFRIFRRGKRAKRSQRAQHARHFEKFKFQS